MYVCFFFVILGFAFTQNFLWGIQATAVYMSKKSGARLVEEWPRIFCHGLRSCLTPKEIGIWKMEQMLAVDRTMETNLWYLWYHHHVLNYKKEKSQ